MSPENNQAAIDAYASNLGSQPMDVKKYGGHTAIGDMSPNKRGTVLDQYIDELKSEKTVAKRGVRAVAEPELSGGQFKTERERMQAIKDWEQQASKAESDIADLKKKIDQMSLMAEKTTNQTAKEAAEKTIARMREDLASLEAQRLAFEETAEVFSAFGDSIKTWQDSIEEQHKQTVRMQETMVKLERALTQMKQEREQVRAEAEAAAAQVEGVGQQLEEAVLDSTSIKDMQKTVKELGDQLEAARVRLGEAKLNLKNLEGTIADTAQRLENNTSDLVARMTAETARRIEKAAIDLQGPKNSNEPIASENTEFDPKKTTEYMPLSDTSADATQETAQVAEITPDVNVDLSTISEPEPSAEEPPASSEDRGVFPAVTEGTDEATQPEANATDSDVEATVTQTIATPAASTSEPFNPNFRLDINKDVSLNEISNKGAVAEMSQQFGISEGQLRMAVREWMRNNYGAGKIDTGTEGVFSDSRVDEVAANFWQRETRPNPGESIQAYMKRLDDEARARGTSLMDKLRAAIPELKITFGPTNEARRADLDAQIKSLNDQLAEINGNDHPSFYNENGEKRNDAEIGRIRSEARIRLEAQRGKLQEQLSKLSASEGQGGGETEKRGWKFPGTELWRRFKDKYNARQDRIQAEKTSAEAADFRQNLENRMMRFYDVNKNITDLKAVNTLEKHVIFAENVRIIATLANELKTNGRARLQTEMQVPFIAEGSGMLQLENVSRNATAEQFLTTLKELLRRTTEGVNMERMTTYPGARQAVDQARSLLQ